MSSQIDMESTMEAIKVMRGQECRGYQTFDYLAQIPADSTFDAAVDASCRNIMAKWCNEIADFCNYSRDTASVAVSCLDRFMATADGRNILMDRNLFQLAAMTALYTAVKIHEHEAMDPNLVSTLSRGAHSPQAVEAMEFRMLNAIQWRVNPPTAMSFVHKMLDLVPQELMDSSERETVLELTQFQVDLATVDYEFSQASSSTIAFASLLNSVESVATDGMFLENFEAAMSSAVQIDVEGIRDIRIGLYEAISENEPMDLNMSSRSFDEKEMDFSASQSNIHTSPRSVSA